MGVWKCHSITFSCHILSLNFSVRNRIYNSVLRRGRSDVGHSLSKSHASRDVAVRTERGGSEGGKQYLQQRLSGSEKTRIWRRKSLLRDGMYIFTLIRRLYIDKPLCNNDYIVCVGVGGEYKEK